MEQTEHDALVLDIKSLITLDKIQCNGQSLYFPILYLDVTVRPSILSKCSQITTS